MSKVLYILGFVFVIISCKNETKQIKQETNDSNLNTEIKKTSPEKNTIKRNALKSFAGLADTTFIRLADFSEDFEYDLRYATTNNFLKYMIVQNVIPV